LVVHLYLQHDAVALVHLRQLILVVAEQSRRTEPDDVVTSGYGGVTKGAEVGGGVTLGAAGEGAQNCLVKISYEHKNKI